MNVAIIIPVYKSELSWYEKISLAQALKVFKDEKIVFIMPEGFWASYLPQGRNFFAADFPPHYFADLYGYNRLMLEPFFYRSFDVFDYILIYQLDAFVFSNRLAEFCALGCDYIGAPWFFGWGHRPERFGKNVFLRVGNGGFSLRNPRACLRMVDGLAEEWNFSEDNYFALCGREKANDFRLASVKAAYDFSWEFHPQRCLNKNGGRLPFGCHAWERYSADFYAELLPKFGYDLSPYRHLMLTEDLPDMVYALKFAALSRLVARVENGRSIAACLPVASSHRRYNLHVIDEKNLPLAYRLIKDGVADANVKIYPEERLDLLARALYVEGDHLLVSAFDEEATDGLKKRGVFEGRHFVSFWREYIRRETRILRSICRVDREL